MEKTEKTQASYIIELLARLAVADASFLTTREKIIFLKELRSGEIFSEPAFSGREENLENSENLETSSAALSFEEKFRTLTLDSISFCVKRTFSRVKWTSLESLRRVKLAQKIMNAQNIKSTCILDADFPAMLREMKDPPFLLFYRGNLEILNRNCVSVVGTRRASPSALRAASDFSKSACDAGFCVVSGLAFGIDAASHKGALLSQNPATCAVLPAGIDTITPRTHTRLAAKILEKGGLLLSEYLPGTPAAQFRYVQRNRIVAALSPATLVVQAPAGSGAMITAGLALDYNREVLFHSECFSKETIELNQNSVLQWKKMNDTPRHFVDDGAAVIANFEEFKEVLNYGKGERKD